MTSDEFHIVQGFVLAITSNLYRMAAHLDSRDAAHQEALTLATQVERSWGALSEVLADNVSHTEDTSILGGEGSKH